MTGVVADRYAGKSILVTGASGVLGTSLVAALRHVPCRIIRLSRDPSKLVHLDGAARIEDRKGDIRSAETWAAELPGSDVVFHLAGQTSVYTAEQDPIADHDSNVRPILLMGAAARSTGSRPSVVFAGTATEIGLSRYLPVDEGHPDEPVTVYDLHKLTAERYLKLLSRQRVVRGVTLRLANVYGPGPASSSADRGVLSLMVRRALRGEPITIYGTGGRLRDYVFIDDVIDAFLLAGAGCDRVDGQHLVVGTGKGWTLRDAMHTVASRVAELTGTLAPLTHVPAPAHLSPIEDRDFVADPARLCKSLGWMPRIALPEGIDRTVAAFRQVA